MKVLASAFLAAVVAGGCANSAGVNAAATSSPTPTQTASQTPSATPSATPSVSPTPTCITDFSTGDHVVSCGPLSFDVHVPAACASGCGIVLDVHGLAMNGRMEDHNTGMRALGDQYGYVIVQPNSTGTPPFTGWNPDPDYDEVYTFLLQAIGAWSIDPDRVHMTGFSMGGTMTFAFVCAHADLFASVAAASAHLLSCSFSGDQTPSRQLPILQMHGTKDALVNFTLIAETQRDQILSGWNMDAGTVIGGDGTFLRTRYVNPQGTVYEFLQHDYASTQFLSQGHCYPGSTDPGGEPGQIYGFGCAPPNSFIWGVEAMAFFRAHPRS